MEKRECCGGGCEDCVLRAEEELRSREAARILAEESEEETVSAEETSRSS